MPASTRNDPGHNRSASHLVSDPELSPTPALHRHRGWARRRSQLLDRSPSRFSRACACALQGLSRQAAPTLRTGPLYAQCRYRPLVWSSFASTSGGQDLGRLQQGSHGRPRSGTALPWPLYSSHRPRQRTAARSTTWSRELPLSRPPSRKPEKNPHPPRLRICSPLPPPRPAPRLCSRSTLRPAGQWLPRPTPRPGPANSWLSRSPSPQSQSARVLAGSPASSDRTRPQSLPLLQGRYPPHGLVHKTFPLPQRPMSLISHHSTSASRQDPATRPPAAALLPSSPPCAQRIPPHSRIRATPNRRVPARLHPHGPLAVPKNRALAYNPHTR